MIVDLDTARDVVYKYAKAHGESALKDYVNNYTCPIHGGKLSDTEKEMVLSEALRRRATDKYADKAEIEDPACLTDIEGHEPWYDEWKKNNPGKIRYWRRLEEFLLQKFSRKYPEAECKVILKSINTSADAVLSVLEDPFRAKPFNTKGLVIGYVQSGKTSNFTSVIAKAADAGYKIILVLSGIHEILRRQTQDRLDAELTGKPFRTDTPRVAPPVLGAWQRLTNYQQEFTLESQTHFSQAVECEGPLLAVIKKNCTVLRKFYHWAAAAPAEERARYPILIIDDEADQASIDTNYDKTAKSADTDPSKTNELIRKIVSLFDRHAYIGYTATPFANILVSSSKRSLELGRDFYPRNFIISLPKPEDFQSYMGSKRIFDDGIDKYLVKHVAKAELGDLLTTKRTQASVFPRKITVSMQKALYSFVLAAAARRERKDGNEPASMLVHTSQRKCSHSRMTMLIEKFIEGLKSGWDDKNERRRIESALNDLWKEDFVPATQAMRGGKQVVEFDAVKLHIDEVLKRLTVIELNERSDEKLDYQKKPDQVVIAVGGNKLSRGLTLEGLLVSFYIRPTNQYDTLLQMGRWFGYRPNYEDLVRVFTTKKLSNWFKHLSLVEEELRKEISAYQGQITPADFAPRVRDHESMRVTAKNKMGAGDEMGGYAQSTTSTFWIPLDKKDVLCKNLEVTKKFLKDIHREKAFRNSKNKAGFIAKCVDGKKVLAYLKEYVFASKEDTGGSGLDSKDLLKYIAELQGAGELLKWNVGIASPQKSKTENKTITIAPDLTVVKVVRNRRKMDAPHFYRVGSLTNPSTLRLDRESGEEKLFSPGKPSMPLVIVYFIDKNSEPVSKDSDELPLFKGIAAANREDVVGLGFVFPRSNVAGAGWVGQNVYED